MRPWEEDQKEFNRKKCKGRKEDLGAHDWSPGRIPCASAPLRDSRTARYASAAYNTLRILRSLRLNRLLPFQATALVVSFSTRAINRG